MGMLHCDLPSGENPGIDKGRPDLAIMMLLLSCRWD